MQFIDDRFVPVAATPCLILPVENIGVDHFAWSVNVPRLKPGGGVGDFFFTIDPKIVEGPGPCRIGGQFKPTLLAPLKRKMRMIMPRVAQVGMIIDTSPAVPTVRFSR